MSKVAVIFHSGYGHTAEQAKAVAAGAARVPGPVVEFIRLDNARQGIVTATAISAAPLEPAEVRELIARLEQLTGGSIELSQSVDPSLLGGIQVRLGDRLIDGSVRGRLERLRHRLASGAL